MSAVMRPVVYQEAHPERARTHRSTAEAFRELPYSTAVWYWPAPRRWRVVDALCFLLSVAALTSPWWWPR